MLLLLQGTVGTPSPPLDIVAANSAIINGVERELLNGWTIDETANGRNVLNCSVVSKDGTYRPIIDEVITIDAAGERKFGGLITSPLEEGVLGEPITPIVTNITAADYNILPSRRFINETIPAGTLKAALVRVQAYLNDYGTTLDPVQLDGPALPAIQCEDKRADDLLNQLTTLSNGYVWNINYFNVLSAKLPTADAAPFNLTDNDTNHFGDITIEPTREDFANRIIVRAGAGTHDVNDTFTGDGVTSSFTLSTPLVNHYGFVGNASSNETLSLQGIGFDLAATWLYYAVDNTIRRVAGAGPPAGGNLIEIRYIGQFPVRKVADAGVAPSALVERVIEVDDVFDGTVAQALANAYLPQFNVTKRTVRYSSYRSGIHPRQSQTIACAKRNYNAASLITDVRVQHIEGTLFRYDVMAQQGTLYAGSWRDMIKEWGGGGSTSAGVPITVSTFVGQRTALPLGGSESWFVSDPTPTWVNADAINVLLDTSVRGTSFVTVRVQLRALTGSVSARLWNEDDLTSAGVSAVVSSATWTVADFTATLAAGAKRYHLQVLPTVANALVAATGYLE